MSERVFNFNPGPATLPYDVLQQTAADIVDFQGVGMGLIEMSHRSPEFMNVVEETEALVRNMLDIPQNFKVLFLQGGASSQFFMVPMNFLDKQKKAVYLNTGAWSRKAIAEARRFGKISVAYTSEDDHFNHVPSQDQYVIDDDAEYLYFVSNNTIYGTQFSLFPETDKPLICDMSSDIVSRKIDVNKFGLIFAGAQKNLGPAGVTLVLIRDDMLERINDNLPTMLDYRTHVNKGSMFNTPPCFAIYVVREVLKWMNKNGGITGIEKNNRDKASLLYAAIDRSDYYRGHAAVDSRSNMNVSFNLPTAELEAKFIMEAAEQGLKGLKGHRSIGGCRASLYNALPLAGAQKLATFMQEFEAANPV